MAIKFLTSVEGITCIFVALLILAGGISEFIYFRKLCKSTIKGYDDLAKDFENLIT